MDINLLENENFNINSESRDICSDESAINDKYEEGHNRIVTEQGSYKLPLLQSIFTQSNYKLKPQFQRRITWNNKKRSKLIESFIINIPIPPVFIYERDFDSYEVMDGLQRISAIISFYNDEFELEGLDEWSELNGKKYSSLPQKIKEGIDRRQLSTITLLKESAKDQSKAEKMKKMVFERLNTGGVKLEAQEIRNALYDGSFNQLCIKLSADENFRKLWGITSDERSIISKESEEIDLEDSVLLVNYRLYKRMYDVELVLRFFAMRHLDKMQGQLSVFLDNALISGNSYNKKIQDELSIIFEDTMKVLDAMFGVYAFCQYKGEKKDWTKAQRVIYDPICLVVSQNLEKLKTMSFNQDKNIGMLKSMYLENDAKFNGKKQSKPDIQERCDIIKMTILKIIEGL